MITKEELQEFRKKLIASMEGDTTCSDCYGHYLDAIQHLHTLEMNIRSHQNQLPQLPQLPQFPHQSTFSALDPSLFDASFDAGFESTFEPMAKKLFNMMRAFPPEVQNRFLQGINLGLEMIEEPLRGKVETCLKRIMQEPPKNSPPAIAPSWVNEELEKLAKGNGDLTGITSKLVQEEDEKNK